MTQVDEWVAVMVAQVGVLQYGFDDRCGWSHGETDCSGLPGGAASRVGYHLLTGCPSSAGIARICHDQPRPQWMNDLHGPDPWNNSWTVGWGVSAEQARGTLGAFKFHGPNQGIDGDGPRGHIGTSLGDGRSVEAANHALDLIITTFIDERDTYYAILADMEGFAPEKPRVMPMYSPPLQIAADLKNPQGGRWEARPDGTVRYVTKAGDIVEGGMVSPIDKTAFTGRRVAALELRWYKPKGSLLRRAGYVIIATSGEKYVPSAQR